MTTSYRAQIVATQQLMSAMLTHADAIEQIAGRIADAVANALATQPHAHRPAHRPTD